MQVIIPMSGMSQRFTDAGYNIPKFLIDVDGKPIILNILDLYPSNAKFIFIINDYHYENTNIVEVLNSTNVDKNIFKIKKHKLGPGHAIKEIFDSVSDEMQTTINYCDFSMGWNYKKFYKYVSDNSLDGCVITYKGFHPHMLHDNNYAFVKQILTMI